MTGGGLEPEYMSSHKAARAGCASPSRTTNLYSPLRHPGEGNLKRLTKRIEIRSQGTIRRVESDP